MTLLIINCGTSSIKMTLFDSSLNRVWEEDKGSSIEQVLQGKSVGNLTKIGHRVVHGGEKYTQATLITDEVEKDLQTLSELAPLHNPPALEGIALCRTLFPSIPQYAVFDTAFHAHIPRHAALYPIPLALSQKYKIKRYGFHGIAHAYSWSHFAKKYGPNHKVITLHLGSGSSLAAIDSGCSLDTSMGFTPLDGVMMATRSGELDPAILSYLCEKEKKSPDEMVSLLNHSSGLLGICGVSKMEEIEKSDTTDAKLALMMYNYHIIKKIGSYIALLEGVDALIFSGGIGEHSADVRQAICAPFAWLGATLDPQANASLEIKRGELKAISLPSAKISLYVVGSDENHSIAEQILN